MSYTLGPTDTFRPLVPDRLEGTEFCPEGDPAKDVQLSHYSSSFY